MIPVTRPYFPPRKRLDGYLDRIYSSGQLTNNGALVQELTTRLEDYLGVENLLLVANGTLALQVAYLALGVTGAAVTTPFTFPATSSSLAWQGLRAVYAGIDPHTLNMDPDSACSQLNDDVSALVPVHTYGNPCRVEVFEDIANRHGLKVVYDGAHTFGVRYRGESLLKWGDAATLSFHATKLFHTGEGGAIVFRDRADLERAQRLINFGLVNGQPAGIGINAKMSELHAAMGLAVLEDIDDIIARRIDIQRCYREKLGDAVVFPQREPEATENGAYMPILLASREARNHVQRSLRAQSIDCRAYFSPSLDSLSFYTDAVSDRASWACDRVLCLPIYAELSEETIQRIVELVLKSIEEVI